MSKTLNKKPKNKALIFVTILGLILLITTTLYLDSSDSFGFSESLFSGLAFIGLIFTLFMQKEELEMQRNEISENRSVLEKQEEQLRKQRIQMEEQTVFLKKQQNENTFFKMLDLYNDILNNIVIDKDATSEDQKKEKFHGREAINYSMKNVIERIYINSKDRYFLDVVNDKSWLPRSSSGKVTVSDKIQAVIPKYLKDNNDQFGHYFRHIFQTIKFADENMIEKELIDNNAKYGKKKNTSAYRYVKILRAQLSNTELALLFYTSLTSEGKNFIDLGYFQDYELLKNLQYDRLVPIELLKDKAELDESYFECNNN